MKNKLKIIFATIITFILIIFVFIFLKHRTTKDYNMRCRRTEITLKVVRFVQMTII